MLELQKFFVDFEHLSKRLECRGITKDHLLFIKQKITSQKELITVINKLRRERNKLSKDGQKNAKKVKELKKDIFFSEEKMNCLETELNELVNMLPNLPSPDVPGDEEGNKVIDSTEYFHDIKHKLTHELILEKLKMISEEKGKNISGSKFVVYQGFGSELLHALINFMRVENHKRGYYLLDTPYLVNARSLYNTGQFHKFQDNLYKIEESNLYLLPTSEVSLVNLYQNQTLSEEDLPLNLCAYSPCFRAERMASGQKNKGLTRLHQFHKVELVKLVKPENSYEELTKLVSDARNILNKLSITHRVIELCHKELGFSSARTHDLEILLPISKKWLEISSCSNCEDFQSRRSQIKIKTKENKKYYLHTLNGSALAVDRLIIALCEYYYDYEKNEIVIPEVLQKYFFR